ncbi:MAG: glycosyltransferase family 4 protein [Candidatus Heimdallarchaeota archaeon]|nr:glycosyltransferase family 4 protein [Candidatus Heimdallarchaeota archaeon]
MKEKTICYLTQEYAKGATWIYCANLAEELSRTSNWKPFIIAANRDKQATQDETKDYKLILTETSDSKFFYSRQFWKNSRVEVDKINPTLVHGNMNLLSSLGIKKKTTPIIETVHTTFNREKEGAKAESNFALSWVEKRVRYFYPWLRRIEKKLLHRADHLIAVSDTIKEELIHNYSVNEDKITVIPNGVNINLHKRITKQIYKKKEDDFVLGFLARMTASKGARMLLPILHQVKQTIPGIKLLLAGDDLNTKQYMVKQIEKYSLQDNVVNLGYIYDLNKKNSFFSTLDMFLLPSSHEGMSLTILEALSCKTPILASEGAVTFDHMDSIIVTPRTVKDFSEKIIELYKNREKLENKKEISRRVAESFTWENTAKLTQSVYEKVV